VNELTVDECRAERSEALTNVLPRWVETVPTEGTEVGSGCSTQRGITSG
jgi:hypothetical protein